MARICKVYIPTAICIDRLAVEKKDSSIVISLIKFSL